MKRCILPVAAASAVALAAANGALAEPGPQTLVPIVGPQVTALLGALRGIPHPAPSTAPKHQPRPEHHLRITTLSI